MRKPLPSGRLRNAYLYAMTQPPATPASGPLHPRNRHRGRYDLAALAQGTPALAAFVVDNPYGDPSIDFANPAAVKTLNQALLRHYYDVPHWDVPAGYLVPPIPGRADYLHYLADLLAIDHGGTVPTGKRVRVLDVGVGASCIYPILGTREYGWRFVGTDVDATALRVAKQIVAANPGLAGAVELRRQPNSHDIFSGLLKPKEVFDLTMCNPPFHASAAEAEAAGRRKERHLGTAQGPQPTPNFGGQATELWYPGGEGTFLWRMAEESALLSTDCCWFTSLVSKKETLPGLYKSLRKLGAAEVRTVPMAQGQKVSRFVAWSFLEEPARRAWAERRWGG